MKIIDSFPEKKTHNHLQICTPHLPSNFKAFLDALKPIYKIFPGTMEARFFTPLLKHKYTVWSTLHTMECQCQVILLTQPLI